MEKEGGGEKEELEERLEEKLSVFRLQSKSLVLD